MRKLTYVLICFAITASIALSSCQPMNTNQQTNNNDSIPGRQWWKETVVYQIYPRSFKDGDGDGVGDLKGIIAELDYIKSLGVNVIWLNPIYQSPNFDNGYDVSDYYKIQPQFGTMQDFDALLKGLHERGIKLVMDIVVNHSSWENEWFKQAKSARNNPYRNYYHWLNAEKGKPIPRYSFFDVNNNAWQYDTATNAYYLHYFAKQQPDLNWENPALRQDVYKMMRFWADKGVDGMRMDAFQYVAKDTSFPQFPQGYEKNIAKYYGGGPHLHEYIQEMNREVFSKNNMMSVAEGAGTSPAEAMDFVAPERHEFSMAYHFEGIDFGHFDPNYSIPGFKQVYSTWDSSFAEKGWLAIFLANHDQPRMVSHWGNDSAQYRDLSSKMLTTFIMTMRGTPYYYYGDELGMTNIRFDSIGDYRDIETINKYKHIKATGGDVKQFMEERKIASRENGRTPFQWDSSLHAGFTTGTPWLKVNPNYTTVNRVAEEKDPNSVLQYFRRAVKLRKDNLVLVYGKYTLLDKENPSIYAYTRELNGNKLLVMLNFKNKTAAANTGIDLSHATLLLGNYANPSTGATLQPYEAVVYQL